MEEIGRWLAAMGFVIVALGAIVWCLGRVAFHELPDGFAYHGERSCRWPCSSCSG